MMVLPSIPTSLGSTPLTTSVMVTLRLSPNLTLTPGRPPTSPMAATPTSPSLCPDTSTPSALAAAMPKWPPPPPPRKNLERPLHPGSPPSPLLPPLPPPHPPLSLPLPVGSTHHRQVQTPYPDRDTIAATFPDIAAEVLRSSNCALPLFFTAQVNSKGTVTLLGVDPSTPASDYSPFFSALVARLTKSFPVGTSPWLPFRSAPNENQFAIHGLPLRYLPSDPEGLFVYLKSAILNAKGLQITSARFLNDDPDARALQDASSVVVTTTPEEGRKMGSHIFLLSRKREVKVAHSANKTTRCRNCQRYGHTAPVCKYTHPVCPIYALHHRKAEH